MDVPPIIPYAVAAGLPPSPPQLTPEHLRQLAISREAVRKIRRAAAVAQFDGVTLAVCAAISLLLGYSSPAGLAVGLGLGLAAYVELRGVAGLRKLNPRVARTLGLNQLGIVTLLVLYCVWRIHAELTGTSQITNDLATLGVSDPGLAQIVTDAGDTSRMIILAVYGAVIAVAVFAQGGLALYYFSRRRHIESYLAETPPWVVAVQTAGGEL